MRHLHGAHWAGAALAAISGVDARGVRLAGAARALTTFHPLPGRLNWLDGLDGSIVLDDSHNATPASALAGLDALAAVGAWRSAHASRIAVLGDMLRLGAEEEAAPPQVGRPAAGAPRHRGRSGAPAAPNPGAGPRVA